MIIKKDYTEGRLTSLLSLLYKERGGKWPPLRYFLQSIKIFQKNEENENFPMEFIPV
jgi:hypothetical protein